MLLQARRQPRSAVLQRTWCGAGIGMGWDGDGDEDNVADGKHATEGDMYDVCKVAIFRERG